jgi:peptidoglycan/LPS O-acetylase OafA/YrhL
MAGFAVGVGLAMLFHEAQKRGAETWPEWVHHTAQGVALLYFLWATYRTGWSHTPRDVWFATSLYVMIFVLAFDRGFLARAMSMAVPRKLGEWSYAIYMGQTFWLQAVRYFEQRWYPPGETMVLGLKFSDVMWWLEPFLLTAVCVAWGALLAIAIEHPANAWLRRKFAAQQTR